MKYCTKCGVHKSKTEFGVDNQKKDNLRSWCKHCTNKGKSKYYYANKEVVNKKANEYNKKRYREDDFFRLKSNMRRRLHKAFAASNWSKKTKTAKMLGTDFYTAKVYLESMFGENMSWDNYGEWHIDHIIPLASAKTEEELIKLCHYTNLQPLWAEDNLKKGDKIL